jgi:hypothetical protein
MKRLLPILTPFIFIVFGACGGGDPSSPPPPAASPAGQQTLGVMQSQVAQAKQSCSSSFAQPIAAAASGQQQGLPVQALLSLMNQGNTSDCSNLLMNIIAQATHVDNGQWIQNPASKYWLALQTAAIMQMTAQKAGLNPQAAQNLLPVVGQFAQQSLIPSLAPGAGVSSGSLSQTIGQYAH